MLKSAVAVSIYSSTEFGAWLSGATYTLQEFPPYHPVVVASYICLQPPLMSTVGAGYLFCTTTESEAVARFTCHTPCFD